jgi:hypothetical protein
MKVIFVLLTALVIAVLLPTAMPAQPEGSTENPFRKGRIVLGTEFFHLTSSLDIEDPSGSTYEGQQTNIDLRLGYMIIKNLEVGFLTSLKHQRTKIENEFYISDIKERATLLGAYGRFHIPIAGGFGGFVSAKIDTGISEVINPDPTAVVDMKIRTTVYGIGGGLVYHINDHCGFELVGYYLKVNNKEDDEFELNYDMDGTSFVVSYGVVIIL